MIRIKLFNAIYVSREPTRGSHQCMWKHQNEVVVHRDSCDSYSRIACVYARRMPGHVFTHALEPVQCTRTLWIRDTTPLSANLLVSLFILSNRLIKKELHPEQLNRLCSNDERHHPPV